MIYKKIAKIIKRLESIGFMLEASYLKKKFESQLFYVNFDNAISILTPIIEKRNYKYIGKYNNQEHLFQKENRVLAIEAADSTITIRIVSPNKVLGERKTSRISLQSNASQIATIIENVIRE